MKEELYTMTFRLNILLIVLFLFVFLPGKKVADASEKYDDNISFYSTGTVSGDLLYQYAPTVLYDETEGLYKLWSTNGVAGDVVGYKESVTIENLGIAPWQITFTPTYSYGDFDRDHTGESVVIKDDGIYYLYYTGQNYHSETDNLGRIGVAVSDTGKDFKRINGGFIIESEDPDPDLYGVGQPAVAVGPDGWYYMIYSSSDKKGIVLKLIKSDKPTFDPLNDNIIFIRDIQPYETGGVSVDLAYNPSRKEFIVICNTSLASPGNIYARLNHFDISPNFKLQGYSFFHEENGGFRFGEGIGILTNSKREIGRYFIDKKHAIPFVAATMLEDGCYDSNNNGVTDYFDYDEDGIPCYVKGPMNYAIFLQEKGPNGVIENFSLDGWDIGLFNPFDQSVFYIFYGEGSGWYADPTGWTWDSGAPNSDAQIFTGDFNGNGLWDIGLYNPYGSGGLFFRFGNGFGGFVGEAIWNVGIYQNAQIFTGDFDGDGYWDIGLYNPNNTGDLYIQYNDQNGGFGGQTILYGGVFKGAQVFTGRFNKEDNYWDIGLYNSNNSGNFYILYGNGNGRFGKRTNWHWGDYPGAKVFSGDFNGDNLWDIGLYNKADQGNFYMQHGDGVGGFSDERVFRWGVTSGSVFTGKFLKQ